MRPACVNINACHDCFLQTEVPLQTAANPWPHGEQPPLLSLQVEATVGRPVMHSEDYRNAIIWLS